MLNCEFTSSSVWKFRISLEPVLVVHWLSVQLIKRICHRRSGTISPPMQNACLVSNSIPEMICRPLRAVLRTLRQWMACTACTACTTSAHQLY